MFTFVFYSCIQHVPEVQCTVALQALLHTCSTEAKTACRRSYQAGTRRCRVHNTAGVSRSASWQAAWTDAAESRSAYCSGVVC